MATVLLLGSASVVRSQVVWSEDFNNGCTSLCLAAGYSGSNGAWSLVDVSSPGAAANTWYVSCAENGNAEGQCGTGCGNDASLHVGNVSTSPAAFLWCPTGDCGATYDTTGATVVSSQRMESPRIDLSGLTGLRARFVYLGTGQPCADSADFVFSDDDGLSWSVLAACITSVNTGCRPQGRWTRLSVDLPASANDNSDVRLGFHWRNNGDSGGRDPSFAVDGLAVETACDPLTPLAVDLDDDLRVSAPAGTVDLDWSLMGAVVSPTTHFHVYRWTSPAAPFPAGWSLVAGDGPSLVGQAFSDGVLADGLNHYYDVRAADDCEAIGR